MKFSSGFWRPASILVALAATSAVLLSGIDHLTQKRIELNHQMKLQTRLNELIPVRRYDNDLLKDSITISDPALGNEQRVWRARNAGEPVAVAMTVIAPDGYSGPIRLLVGIDADGSLLGVRTLEHHETPGLGDDIEIERSPWMLAFDDKSLESTKDADWAVRRDGGAFDQFSGATITPRAVVLAVQRTLLYFRSQREALFSRPPDSR